MKSFFPLLSGIKWWKKKVNSNVFATYAVGKSNITYAVGKTKREGYFFSHSRTSRHSSGINVTRFLSHPCFPRLIFLPCHARLREETRLSRRLNPWLPRRKHGERKSLPEPIFPYAVLKNRSHAPDTPDQFPSACGLWRVFLPIRAHRSKRALNRLARSVGRYMFLIRLKAARRK